MALGTPIAPTAIGSSTKQPTTAKTATSPASRYAAGSVQGFGGMPMGTPPPGTGTGGGGGSGGSWGPNDPPPPPPQQPIGTTPDGIPYYEKPAGVSPNGMPYWSTDDGRVTYTPPGYTPPFVYNPTGASEAAVEQQQKLEQQFAEQQKAMSDWLTGAYGASTADYTGRMDELWEQSNSFLPAQYGYYGNLIGQEYDNRRWGTQLSGVDNEAQRQHAQQAWNLLQTDIGNRRGTTTDSWDELRRYLGVQSGLAGEGWSNTVQDINARRGSTTDQYNEAIRWLQEQGGYADQEMKNLVDALNNQRGTISSTWDETRRNSQRLGGEAGTLLDILSGQIGDQRTGARRDIDLARLVAEQMRGTTTERQTLAFDDAARAREAQDYARQSQSIGQGSLLSRGTRLQMGRNLAAQNAANSAANLGWTESMNSIDATQQGAENQFVDVLNALNTNQRQANLGYESTMGGLQHGLNQGAIDVQAALQGLEARYRSGQLGYQQTMGGLQHGINDSGISYQAAMQALQHQYNQGQLGYRGQMAGFQNQMNQGGIDYTAALNALNNQYGVGANNYQYAMSQSDIEAQRIRQQLAGLGIGEQQALFGNNMNLWNAQQGISQQMNNSTQTAAQQWQSYMQQMMALGLPMPSNPPSSPYGYVPTGARPRGTINPRLS